MADASRDQNRVTTMLALSYIDGVTLVPVQINPSNNGIKIDTTHTATAVALAARDQNFVQSKLGVSSADSATIVTVFADPVEGAILVDM